MYASAGAREEYAFNKFTRLARARRRCNRQELRLVFKPIFKEAFNKFNSVTISLSYSRRNATVLLFFSLFSLLRDSHT